MPAVRPHAQAGRAGSRLPPQCVPVCNTLASALLACAVGASMAGPGRAQDTRTVFRLTQLAQQTGFSLTVRPSLNVPSSSSVALPISVPSPRELPPNSFVRIRGLPPALALSEGFAIGPGVWAVPLAALSTLRLVIPVGVAGISEVTISLVAVDGAPLAEAKLRLTVFAPSAPGPQTATPSTPLPSGPKALAPAPAPPALTPETRERAERFVQRGEKELTDGNIAQARGFFLRAAEAGLARGALMLASTYDPSELARLRVQGVMPNPAEARKWYERARDLGAPEATERLSGLDRR